MTQREKERFLRSALFDGCEEAAREAISSGEAVVKNYGKGMAVRAESVSKDGAPRGALIVLLAGRLKVGAREDMRKLTVSQMEPGAVFGFTSLFVADNAFETDVRAAGAATVCVLPEELIERLIASYPCFALRIIAIQAEKIRFLNRKILSYTAPSGVKRFWDYLRSLPRDKEGSVTLPLGMAPLAARLGMSRASLYRAEKELENAGKIRKAGNKIFLTGEK